MTRYKFYASLKYTLQECYDCKNTLQPYVDKIINGEPLGKDSPACYIKGTGYIDVDSIDAFVDRAFYFVQLLTGEWWILYL